MKVIKKIQIAAAVVITTTIGVLVSLKTHEASIKEQAFILAVEQPKLFTATLQMQQILSRELILISDLLVTGDIEAHRLEHAKIHGKVIADFEQLRLNYFDTNDLDQFERASIDYHNALDNLYDTLAKNHNDKALLIEQVERIKAPYTAFENLSNQLLTSIQHKMVSAQKTIEKQSTEMERNVFYVGLLLLTLLLLSFINLRRLKRIARHEKRLSQFIERSPEAVLTVDDNGTIIYANPKAYMLIEDIGLDKEQLQQLLPVAIKGIINELREGHTDTSKWSHHLRGITFETTLQWMRDLDKGHVYLHDITQSEALQKRLNFLAYFDPLTHLPNRRRFEEEIDNIINLNRYGQAQNWAVGLIRLDRFAHVTTGQGYNIGDQLLAAAATRMKESLLEYHDAHLFRFDGARLGILALEEQGSEIVEILNAAMMRPIVIEDSSFYLTLSIGYTITPGDVQLDSSKLIINAGAALERATEMGGNHLCQFSEEMRTQELQWVLMESDLRRSLNENNLELFYQPQINTEDGSLVGMEALARWKQKNGSYIPPSEFITLAERVGLIETLGIWVLREACQQAVRWEAEYGQGIVIAVNVSSKQFNNPQFLTTLEKVLVETNVDPRLLEIEITETAMMQNMAIATETISQIKKLGMSVSIDDFGTGYSSMSYLKDLSVQKIKIDRAFIMGISSEQTERVNKDKAIVTSILELGHNLNMKVIAEGVDDSEQVEFLTKIGCDELQGFLISPPRPAQELNFMFEDNVPDLNSFDN